MAIRIREDGTILCAAMSEPEPGDTYIHDGLHYRLSVDLKVLVPDINHFENGLWYWLNDVFPVVGDVNPRKEPKEPDDA